MIRHGVLGAIQNNLVVNGGGQGIRNVSVPLFARDGSFRIATTDNFGRHEFDSVEAGETKAAAVNVRMGDPDSLVRVKRSRKAQNSRLLIFKSLRPRRSNLSDDAFFNSKAGFTPRAS